MARPAGLFQHAAVRLAHPARALGLEEHPRAPLSIREALGNEPPENGGADAPDRALAGLSRRRTGPRHRRAPRSFGPGPFAFGRRMTRVLVSGGTGTVGRFIVEHLLGHGYKVTVGGREPPAAGFFSKDVAYVPLHLEPDLDQIDAFQNIYYFVHAAFAHVPG